MEIYNIVIDNNKDSLENPDFEQKKFSKTSTGIYKIAQDSIRLMEWIYYYDRSFYENIKYYDLMGFISKYLNESSQR